MSSTEGLTAHLERASGQLAMFEGRNYPDAQVVLTGGIEGSVHDVLPDVTAQPIGTHFEVVVRGTITAKKYALKHDKDGLEIRTLVVTLKADDITGE